MTTDPTSAAATAQPERFVATRTVAAAPDRIFALLADPSRHHETEPGTWVRDAVEAKPEPLSAVGQTFAVRMFLDKLGGDYTMVNRVTEFEAGRTIAWAPGILSRSGRVSEGGHIWRYDLEPDGDGTRVTLTYDWSAMPQATREWLPSGAPPFPASYLDASLAALERAVSGTAPASATSRAQ